jgi:ankyrin repeat protein
MDELMSECLKKLTANPEFLTSKDRHHLLSDLWSVDLMNSFSTKEYGELTRNGYEIALKKLIDIQEYTSDKKWIIKNAAIIAATFGYIEMVKMLLLECDKKDINIDNLGYAIVGAAIEGHLDIVKLLLPYSDVDDLASALEGAMKEGKMEIVNIINSYINTI